MATLSRRSVVVGGALAAVAALDMARNHSAQASQRYFAVSDHPGVITVAEPGEFPGVDPTGATDSTAGLQAALDATLEGGTLIVPNGTYLLRQAIAPKSGRSVRIQGYGATLVATGGASVISLRGQYDGTLGVTQVREVAQAFASGVTEVTSVLTVYGTPGWRSGDVIKVVSDDSIEGARDARNRRGEFATVLSSVGSTVTLTARLRDAYAQNVRVARVSRQTIRVEGFEVQTAEGQTGSDALLSFTRLFDPVVKDVSVMRAAGPAIRFSSCFGYRAEGVDVSYAQDAAGEGVLGYGVLDNASSYGRIVGGTFRHVRHAYTDDTPTIAANDSDLANYGRTYGTVLVGVHAVGTTSAAFSTHHSSEGVHFEACRATGGVPGGTSAVAFELRGRRHRVSSCSAVALTNGVLIRTESAGGESRGHLVSDFRGERLTNAAVRIEIHPTGHPQAKQRDSETNVRIEGVSSVDSLRLVYAENARFSISGGHYHAPAGVDGALLEGFFLRNCDASIRDVVLDYCENVAGRPRPVITGGATGFTPGRQDTTIDGLEIRITPEAASRAYFVFGGVENRVYGSGIRLTHPFPRVLGESHADTSWTWSVDARPGVAGSGAHSAYFAFKTVVAATQWGEVVKSNDPEVWIHLDTEGKALEIGQLPAGRRRGQRWVFFQSSAGTVKFLHGTTARTSLKGAAARTLWKGRRLDLVWDGSLWHEPVGL
ncbi:hypothetical protein ABIB37_000340 [Agrococcus sp. UYP10]|uniref:glycosyl hydrolase family 28-related protein n=1 Tax=Agrococcus sp. UYP10 TaxID=1756355 RepID=UPI003399AC79